MDDSCLPKEIGCFVFGSAIFWLGVVAIYLTAHLASKLFYTGVTSYQPDFIFTEGMLWWLFFVTLILGALIPATVVDVKGCPAQRKCMAFAFIVLLLTIVLGSGAMALQIPFYTMVGYLLSILMLAWLGYMSFRNRFKTKIWGLFGAFIAIIPIVFLLGLGFVGLRVRAGAQQPQFPLDTREILKRINDSQSFRTSFF